jgi:hypothetical protein
MRIVSEVKFGRTVIQVIENRALLSQRFHVRVSDLNGHILLSSEKYRDRRDADNVVERLLFMKEG